ncbi:MAG: RsbRD N-terminal domain-containing protein [Desulfobulbaceae bacterium]
MNLIETLQENKDRIRSTWIERTLDSYTSSGFFKKSLDTIANPIGSNIRAGLSDLLDLLLRKAHPEEYDKPLDQVIRIRAVQDFSPSRAVVPFLELKWVIRQILRDDPALGLTKELDQLDCDIDRLALAAFDKYMECREQLYQVRIRELKSGSYILSDAPCPSSLAGKGVEDGNSIN